jgi:hypothetical protein
LDIIKMDLLEVGWGDQGWFRIGTGGELLWIRYWTFGFHKMLGNYRVAKQLGISRVVLSSMELVSYYASQITIRSRLVIPVTVSTGHCLVAASTANLPLRSRAHFNNGIVCRTSDPNIWGAIPCPGELTHVNLKPE